MVVRWSMTAEARGAIMAAVAVLLSHMLRKAVTSKKPIYINGKKTGMSISDEKEARNEMDIQ